ncbi:MAG: hypothetical protein BWX46_00474 [Candidatus Cloacimonetes bacterium ADurb.Bin003]|nr:MAG: hypothetical protein BWX46_00474 [Candidatus Cloacimonetes bacterium ADurb.Bin003]
MNYHNRCFWWWFQQIGKMNIIIGVKFIFIFLPGHQSIESIHKSSNIGQSITRNFLNFQGHLIFQLILHFRQHIHRFKIALIFKNQSVNNFFCSGLIIFKNTEIHSPNSILQSFVFEVFRTWSIYNFIMKFAFPRLFIFF